MIRSVLHVLFEYDQSNLCYLNMTSDMTWHGMVWYGMIWYDMVGYDMIWYDMIWYSIIKYSIAYSIYVIEYD